MLGDQKPNSLPIAQGQPPAAPATVKFEDIHTMPDRFLAPDSRKGGGGGKNTLLIVILAVVLLIGGGAAAAVYFVLRPAPNDNANTNALNVNLAPNLNQTNVNASPTNANLDANLNLNQNVNSNANLNSNGSLPGNTNRANLNLNLNQNVNGNRNTNTTVNTNANTNSAVTRTEPLPTTLDSDADGLTDVEELIYGTKADQPDSDGDSFIDGKRAAANGAIIGEVYLSYNPLGIGRLDTSGLVRSFSNTTFNYSILYPAEWLAQAAKPDNRTILFTPSNPTGETVQVFVEDNPTKLTARNYYLSTNPGADPASVEALLVNGLEGIRTSTGEDVYVAKNDKVYQVHYAVGQLSALNFMTTFEMMFQSFRLTSGSVNGNANAS